MLFLKTTVPQAPLSGAGAEVDSSIGGIGRQPLPIRQTGHPQISIHSARADLPFCPHRLCASRAVSPHPLCGSFLRAHWLIVLESSGGDKVPEWNAQMISTGRLRDQ